MQIELLLIGWSLGIIGTLGATLLQAYITKKQIHGQKLTEVRLSVYGRLLATSKSEERYPNEPRGQVTQREVDTYNARLREWREKRRSLKAIAAEALLLAGNITLRTRLSDFISSSNPDLRLDIEDLMREEIGIN